MDKMPEAVIIVMTDSTAFLVVPANRALVVNGLTMERGSEIAAFVIQVLNASKMAVAGPIWMGHEVDEDGRPVSRFVSIPERMSGNKNLGGQVQKAIALWCGTFALSQKEPINVDTYTLVRHKPGDEEPK